jgi:hypothetical protein
VRPNKWHKFDIELDESDLQAIVVKHGIDGDKLTVIQKYKVLVAQAELLVTVEFEKAGGSSDKTSGYLLGEFNEILSKLPKVA